MARPDENGLIQCTGCNRELPGDREHFHQHRDAFKPKCKECRGSSFGVKHINKVKDAKEGHKFCSSCHKELPATEKYFFNGGKDENGLTSQCKKCHSDMGYALPTERPNRGRDDGMWECKNCNNVYERTTENFYTNGDCLMVYCKDCHTRRVNQRRRELENEVKNTLTDERWETVKAEFNQRCAYCDCEPDTIERDHIIPISKGGDTAIENIVPACPSCNRSKGNKTVSEWYADQPFYDSVRESKIIHVNYGRF